MSRLTILAKGVGKFASDNAPTILTAIAVAGVATTAIMASKASVQAHDHLQEVDPENEAEFKVKVAETWKFYIPTVAVGTATIACVIGANTVNTTRAAAMASAFTLSETAFREYKEKVKEQVGANKEQKIRDDIAQDEVRKNPINPSTVIITGNGDVNCYEALSGRYFKSNKQTLQNAEIKINQRIIHENYASLNDFYHLIGLEDTDMGEELGWTTDMLLDLEFSATLDSEDNPCLSFRYSAQPVRNFHRFR